MIYSLHVPDWFVHKKDRGAKTTYIMAYKTEIPEEREIIILEITRATELAIKVRALGVPFPRVFWIPRSVIISAKQIEEIPDRPPEGADLMKAWKSDDQEWRHYI